MGVRKALWGCHAAELPAAGYSPLSLNQDILEPPQELKNLSCIYLFFFPSGNLYLSKWKCLEAEMNTA